uniref:Protein-glutamate methylesterase/protein-glutamine glutaminase n=1 Tax=Desulfatirhabdium butyrativorans TaxID=340467 RepID=A0A7C4RR54_9BACT
MMDRMNQIRVLVVDDSAMYRTIVQDVLSDFEDVLIVGTAENGRKAIEAVAAYRPDMVILDIDMPEMDGMAVLQVLRDRYSHIVPVMFSVHTFEGAQLTVEALQQGAFDFIPKPSSGTLWTNRMLLKNRLGSILEAVKRIKRIRFNIGKKPNPYPQPLPIRNSDTRSRVVGIGVSTGGPQALLQVIPKFPADLDVPVLIVQHMPAVFTTVMAQKLDSVSRIRVKEAEDAEPLRPSTAYVAPGGKHLCVTSSSRSPSSLEIRITDDPPENNCKPSADVLFRSLAEHFGAQATGVIMTGMGADGVEGLRRMKAEGATIIAQDEASCAVFGMPRKAIEADIVDIVAPIETLAAHILRTIR